MRLAIAPSLFSALFLSGCVSTLPSDINQMSPSGEWRFSGIVAEDVAECLERGLNTEWQAGSRTEAFFGTVITHYVQSVEEGRAYLVAPTVSNRGGSYLFRVQLHDGQVIASAVTSWRGVDERYERLVMERMVPAADGCGGIPMS